MKTNKILESFSCLLILFTFLFTSCSVRKRFLSDLEDQLASAPAFQQGFTGLALYDPEEQEMLFEFNSGKYFTPASNIKLYTFYTGLEVLGDSVPAFRYTIRNDSLVFGPTGDPSLLNPDLPPTDVLDFLKKVEQKLFYLPQQYKETPFGPGWAWDDYNSSYSVERSPLPVYGNKVHLEFRQGWEKPLVFPRVFKDSVFKGEVDSRRARRSIYKNSFKFSNKNKKKDFEQDIPFRTSTPLTIALLEDTLDRQIKILDDHSPFPLDQVKYSIPTDSLFKRMLRESDNFLAEQILLLVAGRLSDTLKTDIAIKYMTEHLLSSLPDEPVIVDGSGLSRYNLTTPRNTVWLLEKLKKELPDQKLIDLLPTGGETGTLKRQFQGEEPFIFAKTGSLSNNYSLSGYLRTEEGRILIFSFMNSNYMVPSQMLKSEMEQVIREIRKIY